MRRPLACSVVFHVIAIVIVAVGLPALAPAPPVIEEPIVVDVLPLADRANPPPTLKPAPVIETARPAPPRPAREDSPKPAEPKVASRSEPAPARPQPPKPEPPKPEPPKPEPPKPEAKVEPKPEKPKPQPPQPKPDVAKAEPKPEPPKPEPKASPVEPEPKPQPKPSSRDVAPQSKPEPKPEPKPDSKPEPKQDAKAEQKPDKPASRPAQPKPDVAKAEPKPEPPKPTASSTPAPRKPEPPADDFASVMKAVDDLKQSGKSSARPSPSTTAGKAEKPGEGDLGAQVAQALRTVGPTGNQSSLPVTASEIDAVRRQIERCWNLPAGAKDAGDLVVSIRVEMNLDGTPRTAAVDGTSRGQGNPLFQAIADSARRAVLNPRCHPFKLPPDKYDRWRTMTLIFNPRQMS